MKLFLLTAFIVSSFLIWGPAHGATVTSYSKSKKLVKIDLEGESIKGSCGCHFKVMMEKELALPK